ncbi:MAG TPA: response regulator [Gaiellaceae bacterium]|nr:response regulator [Gaiellaceae bacterium]
MTFSPPAGAGAAETHPLVLIVDDSKKNLKLARDILRRAGLRTIEASRGAEAIAVARDRIPDVILLDLQLPDLGGTRVARALAAEPQTASIPVVAWTARSIEADADWLIGAGFAGFIAKPLHVHEFPALVRSYCVRAGG